MNKLPRYLVNLGKTLRKPETRNSNSKPLLVWYDLEELGLS